MSTIDSIMEKLGGNHLIKVKSTIRGEYLSLQSQDDLRKYTIHVLAAKMVELLNPIWREFISRRVGNDIYQTGEPLDIMGYPRGTDVALVGELFVLNRVEYSALVELVMQLKRELEGGN